MKLTIKWSRNEGNARIVAKDADAFIENADITTLDFLKDAAEEIGDLYTRCHRIVFNPENLKAWKEQQSGDQINKGQG